MEMWRVLFWTYYIYRHLPGRKSEMSENTFNLPKNVYPMETIGIRVYLYMCMNYISMRVYFID